MNCELSKRRKVVHWMSPLSGVLKFNVDGVARDKLGLTGIGGGS